MKMMNVKTYVLCRDAGGSAAFFEMDVSLPGASYDLGYHYDIAMKNAEQAGYESPMQAFDEHEPAGRVFGNPSQIPAILVWLGEGGVEEVIADFPLRYVVVNTDTEYAEEDCLFEVNTGTEIHEALGHTGIGTVNECEAEFVWRQVRRIAEPELMQPVDEDAEAAADALGFGDGAQMEEHQRFLDACMKHRVRVRRMIGEMGEVK